MKNLANFISISRIIMSIILIIPESFTIPFYIIYVYCGISDMLDGYIARKSKNTSKIGSRLDSVAEIIFVIISKKIVILVEFQQEDILHSIMA